MSVSNIDKKYECTIKRNTGIQVVILITRVKGIASNCTNAYAGILVTIMLVNNIDKMYECTMKEIQVFMYASMYASNYAYP